MKRNKILNKLLQPYENANLEVKEKSKYLLYFCMAASIFVVLIFFAHVSEHAHVVQFIGDGQAIVGLILVLYFVRKGKAHTAAYIVIASSMIMAFMVYVVNDWLLAKPIPYLRLYETLAALLTMLFITSLFAFRLRHVFLYAVMSVPILLSHYFVFHHYFEGTYTIHIKVVFIIGILLLSLSIYLATRLIRMNHELLKIANKAVEKSEQKYDSLFSHIQEGYTLQHFIRNDKGLALNSKIDEVNKIFQNYCSIPTDEIPGKFMSDIFPAERKYQVAWIRFLRDLIEHRSVRIELYNNKLNKWVLIHGILLDQDSFITLFHDITEERNVKQQLLEAKEKAEYANLQKSRFLANMSHEIRTPMNGIIGMTNMLHKTSLDPKQKEYAELIKTSANALLDIINDILDLSKIEAGKVELEHKTFNFRRLVTAIYKTFQIRLDETPVEVKLQTPGDLPEYAIGDATRIRQILINIIGNAAKFTDQGQITIDISCIDKKPDFNTYKIVIADTGIGIPKDKLEAIFDAFSQVDVSKTRKKGGTGLGLSITKKLIDLMGGKMRVNSEVGKGSTFEFDLKLQNPSTSQIEEYIAREQEETVDLSELLTARILIAEDNLINQKYIQALLDSLNINHTIVENGQLAVEAFKKHKYDFVLMDVQMPVKDGIEATQEIREIEKERNEKHPIPIIAVTASAFIEDKDKYDEAGMNDFIPKPINEKKLFEILQRHYAKSNGGSDNYDMNNKYLNMMMSDKMIDREQFDKYLGIMPPEVVIEIIDIFFSEYHERVSTLEEAIKERNYEEIRSIAHKFKGTVGQLFAKDAKDLAQILVDKADGKDEDNLDVFFSQFKEMLAKLYEELQEIKSEYQA